MPDLKIIANFVLFQAAWFACVLGAANAQPWLGVGVAAAIVIVQVMFAPKLAKAAALIAIAMLIGAVVDQSFIYFDVVHYQAHGWSASWVPVWIIGLWMAFASTLNVSLRWLHGNALLQLGFGAIGGPLAYYAAQQLGAVSIVAGAISYVVLAVFWGLVTVILFTLATRLDGYDA